MPSCADHGAESNHGCSTSKLNLGILLKRVFQIINWVWNILQNFFSVAIFKKEIQGRIDNLHYLTSTIVVHEWRLYLFADLVLGDIVEECP